MFDQETSKHNPANMKHELATTGAVNPYFCLDRIAYLLSHALDQHCHGTLRVSTEYVMHKAVLHHRLQGPWCAAC